MTPQDLIYGTYTALLEKGWTMTGIDGMDIFGYWRVKAWDAKRRPNGNAPVYLDDIFSVGGG